MHDSTPRRPRFLASLPETPDVAPLRLARGSGRPPPTVEPAARAAAARPDRAAQDHAAIAGAGAPPPGSDPDCGESRREALLRVSAAIETLRAQSAHVAEQARADALEIGFAVARAILATEVRQNPEALFSLVRAAVRRAGDSRRIAVRVAPEDLEVLSEGSRSIDPAAARVELVADRELCRGDCVVEADFGRIDGRLETRFAELRRAVDAAAHERREDVA
jgi:flagellar assembly protein FliH